MASATEADRPSAAALVARGLPLGAVAGLVTGLLDGLLALRAGNEIVGARDVLGVMLGYATAFAACGAVAALVARRFEWPRRALALLVSIGAGLFLVGAWLNVVWLDDFTSAFSLVTDLALLVAAYLLFRRLYHGPGDDRVGAAKWTAAAVASLLVGGAVHAFGPARDDGPAVHAAAGDGPRPNVLVFLVDTLRADALSCYGYERPTSPEVDAFAADAVRFDDCRATTSWTKPSVASLLTSLYPTSHACVQQREILVPDAETLPEVMRAAGWRTAAFVDNPFVTPEFGFGQGYDHVDYVRPSVFANGTLLGKVLFMTRVLSLVGEPFGVGEHSDRGARVLVEEGLLPWIDEGGDAPWFAYVHTMEPHLPYDPPRADAEAFGFPAGADYGFPPKYNGILPFQTAPDPPEGVRESLRAQYDGEVREASRWFGRAIDALRERGLLEKTIVVLVADHGEEFHEHGGWTHGHSLHPEVLRVPLVVRVPDLVGGAAAGRGRHVAGVASLLDVFPTIVDLAGVRHPRGVDVQFGWSLATTLVERDGKGPRGAVPSGRALAAEVTMGPVRLRSLRDGRWHLIRASAPPLREATALYDFVSDPGETRDRQERESLTLTQMEGRLSASFDALAKKALQGAAREIDAETAGLLESLGYVQGK